MFTQAAYPRDSQAISHDLCLPNARLRISVHLTQWKQVVFAIPQDP